MSQKNQSSSNDTSFSFGANAAPAQAINDTPGSQESGGGGTMSYRAAGSIASTSSFTVVNQADVVRGGSARRATSARSPRAARSRIAEDGGGRARRARPRGRMRQVRLPPHPNASHRPAPRGMRARHVFDVNYNTISRSWRGANGQGLNWKTD